MAMAAATRHRVIVVLVCAGTHVAPMASLYIMDYVRNEGINQRNLKIWADVADKICVDIPKNLGVDFRPCSEGNFLTGSP